MKKKNNVKIIDYLNSIEEFNIIFHKINNKKNIKITYFYNDIILYKCSINKYYHNTNKFYIEYTKMFNLMDKNEFNSIILNILNNDLILLHNKYNNFNKIENNLNKKISFIENEIKNNYEKKLKDLNNKCFNLELNFIDLNKKYELVQLNNKKQKTYFYSFCFIGLLYIFLNYLIYQSKIPYFFKKIYVNYN